MKLDDKIQQDKRYKEKEFKSLIVNFIKNKKENKGTKISDIVVGTGLSTDWVEFTLRKLLNDYPAYLDTDEKGELLYFFDFEQKEENFGQKLKQIFQTFLKILWQVFVWVFKLWIILMLISYLLVNVLIIAFALAVITRSGDIVKALIRVVFETSKGVYDFFTQAKKSKGALQQVFAFVFGEAYVKRDDLFLEKIILAFIKENGGKILSSDIVKITAWSLRKAEQEVAQLLANYQGEVEVTEKGLIVYHFDDLKNAKVEKPVEKYEVWHRFLPTPHLNYNSSVVNKNIMYVNTFNLVAPVFSGSIVAWFLEYGLFWDLPSTFFFWLFTFPVIFSVLFFLVPALRYPSILEQQKEVNLINQKIFFYSFPLTDIFCDLSIHSTS